MLRGPSMCPLSKPTTEMSINGQFKSNSTAILTRTQGKHIFFITKKINDTTTIIKQNIVNFCKKKTACWPGLSLVTSGNVQLPAIKS